MKWKIYYDNGTTYCDEDGSPFDAPSLGVQVIAVEEHKVGKVMHLSSDYYWWDAREGWGWGSGDIFGMYDYLIMPGPRKVVFGRLVPLSLYERLYYKAYDDPYLPLKTGIAQNEMNVSQIFKR